MRSPIINRSARGYDVVFPDRGLVYVRSTFGEAQKLALRHLTTGGPKGGKVARSAFARREQRFISAAIEVTA